MAPSEREIRSLDSRLVFVSTEVRIGDDGVPVYDGAYALHADITDGRPAGLNGGDQV